MNGDWLLRGRDGRLTVYMKSDDAVLCRAETAPGGPWEPFRRAGGDLGLQQGPAAVGQGADGYAHLAAWRQAGPGESRLVHCTHFRPLLAPLDWSPVGHPNGKGDRTGTPAVAVDDRRRAYVFVRNAGGGVSLLVQKERGGWYPWRDLKGSGVQDQLAAASRESGLVEVYASTPERILHWRQEEPGRTPTRDETADVAALPGTLRALRTSAERTTLFFTGQDGELCAWRPGGKPVPLLQAAGPGPVAAVRCEIDGHDCTVLAQRSASGRVAFAAYPTEQEQAGAWWTESGPPLPPTAALALAVDAQGTLVAATLDPTTSTLRVTRRKEEAGLALEGWREV